MKLRHLISVMIACVALSAFADVKSQFFLQRLKVPGLDVATRIEYMDSLLGMDIANRDSILLLKAKEGYGIGDYPSVIEAVEALGNRTNRLPLYRQCELQLWYIHSLDRQARLRECLEQCSRLLELEKPDSLVYYDAQVYVVIRGYVSRFSPTETLKYAEKTKIILEEAQRRGLPKHSIDKLRYSLAQMEFGDALMQKKYDKALELGPVLSQMSDSKVSRQATDGNMAFVYMLIGRNDLATKYFESILQSPLRHYSQGVALMNYTHMLNKEGRYGDALEVIDKYNAVPATLNGDLYYSYLMGNKAIALYNVGKFKEAYETLMESKLLGDSLNINAGLQDGLLMLDYNALQNDNEDLKHAYRKNQIWLIIFLVSALLFMVAAIILYVKNRSVSRKQMENLSVIEGLNKRCADLTVEAENKANQDSGEMAAQLLELAGMSEAVEKLSDIAQSNSKDSEAQLKEIKEVLASLHHKGDIRELFERQFEQSHSSFFKHLYSAHTNLSPTEARMCAYLIMNLSTKEIASITHKSVRSVESIRYRIGKKLNISDSGQSVVGYLRTFISE